MDNRHHRPLRVLLLFVTVAMLALAVTPAGAHEVAGRMTGGGSVFTAAGTEVRVNGGNSGRVTHGFQLHCVVGGVIDDPNNLQINWNGNRFHLTQLTEGVCFEDENIDQTPPQAPFDTYRGAGWGRYNNRSGAFARWTFVDAGEPGTLDTAAITIWAANGVQVLTVPTANLTFGNHQAHAA